jgi:hypothetical protein
MGYDGRIDVTKQLQDVLKREEMLAFFDFQFESETGRTISGLCKISRPKEGKARSKYVSLLFIVDTPDGEARGEALSRMASIQWDSLRGELTGLEDILLLPPTDLGSGDFVLSQMDLYVNAVVDLAKPYVFEQLHPAIVKIAGITSGTPVYFPDAGSETAPLPGGSTGDKRGDSLVQKLKRMLT